MSKSQTVKLRKIENKNTFKNAANKRLSALNALAPSSKYKGCLRHDDIY